MNEGRTENGRFTTGNPGKPKGAVTKKTDELRNKITDFLNDNFQKVVTDFEGMKPCYRTRLFVDLLQFALPKLQNTNNKIAFEDMTEETLDKIIQELKKQHNEITN